MVFALGQREEGWSLSTVLVRTVLCLGLYGLGGTVQAQESSPCPALMCPMPSDTFITKTNGNDACYTYGTALTVQCLAGFGESFITVCTADGIWDWRGSCKIDLQSVGIAVLVAFAALFIFMVLMFCLLKRRKPEKRTDALFEEGTAES